MKTLRALFWGCVTGAALAYIFAPRRIDLLRARYGAGSQANTAGAGRTSTGASRSPTTATSSATTTAASTGAATPTTGGMATGGTGGVAASDTRPDTFSAVNAQTATADTAAFIGNTHTHVYHSATDPNLPNEENRAYFATAKEAEEAGYRPAGQATSV